MVMRSAGSIDSLSPESSPFGPGLCRTAPAGSIPTGDILRRARVGELVLVPHFRSIDSFAPANSPLAGLRPCRAAPAGSIPAGDILRHAIRSLNLSLVHCIGSIDSRIAHALTLRFRLCRSLPSSSIDASCPQGSPLRGYVCPAQLPLAVFPPGTWVWRARGLVNFAVIRV